MPPSKPPPLSSVGSCKALTIEFAIANKDALDIDIINLSLGHPIFESAATDPRVQAVEHASRAGSVVVVSAGNSGRDPKTGNVGYAGTASPVSNAPSGISVGSVRTFHTASRDDDRIASQLARAVVVRRIREAGCLGPRRQPARCGCPRSCAEPSRTTCRRWSCGVTLAPHRATLMATQVPNNTSAKMPVTMAMASTAPAVSSDWKTTLPVPEAKGITLRELRVSDAPAPLTLLTTEEVTRFISTPPTTLEGFERFIQWAQRRRAFQVRPLDPMFVGTAEWGFALGLAYRGSGLLCPARSNGRYMDQSPGLRVRPFLFSPPDETACFSFLRRFA